MPLTSSHKLENRCSYCMKETDDIKTCGKCRMVRYCSVECQKSAWKTHKQSCSSHLKNAVKRNPELADRAAVLSQWLAYWRPTIFTWANWMLDIPHHPHDRLQTHVFTLSLVDRPGSHPPSNHYKLEGGGVLTRAEVVEMLEEMDTPKKMIDEWEKDRRGEDTVQIVILDEGQVRFLWFSYRRMDVMRMDLMSTEGIPDVMGALQEDWVNVLAAIIDSGDPTRTQDYFLTKLDQEAAKIADTDAQTISIMKFYQQRNILSRFGLT